MGERFKDKYKKGSIRNQNWDYSRPGFYFITMVTMGRERVFGEIKNGEVILSDAGNIASNIWKQIPEHFEFVRLDEFVIMPDHMHGILEISERDSDEINSSLNMNVKDTIGGITGKNNPMLHKNLSRVVRWYKGKVTFEIRKFNHQFGWQPRFYDRIIRDERHLNATRNYIKSNPEKWQLDRSG
jgi:REP element-mobilizing transposase RayT